MKDKNRAREEVIKELQHLHQRITELEALETEYRLADALQERYKNLQMLFDSLDDCLFVLDMEGCILSVNNVVLRRLGYSEAELLGENMLKVHPPDRQDEVAAIISDMVADKANSCPVPLMTKDGIQIPVETKVTRGRWDNQDVFFGVSRDISERTQVEHALKNSEGRFRDLYENAPNAYFSVGTDGLIHNANKRAEELLGYSVQELVGRPVFALYTDTPQGKGKASKTFEKFLAGGTVTDEELQMQKKDGTPVWVSLTVNTVRNGTGHIIESRSMVVDITKRKRAEKELEKSKKRFQHIFHLAPLPILEEDLSEIKSAIDGIKAQGVRDFRQYLDSHPEFLQKAAHMIKVLDVNEATLKLFGAHSKEELLGSLDKIFVPESYSVFKELLIAMNEGKTHFESEGINQTLQGKRLDIFLTIESPAEKAEFNQMLVGIIDITKRKRAEEALKQSEGKYRMLFEGAKDGIYITSREGILVDANQSLLDLFGYTSEDLEGLDINRTYLDSASRLRFQKAIEKNGSVRDYEIKLRKKDGTEIDCLISATLRRDSGRKIIGYQGIIHDITDYKRTEEELAYLATHDALTGLPNRMLFSDRLTLALVQAQRHEQKLAVMLLDLDYFKDINDTLGHNEGDHLLREVSNRLVGILRKSDTIARMGGDEFLLLLQEIAEERYAINIARKLVNAFRKPFVMNDHELHITTSVGIAIYPEDGEEIDTLLGNADIAMYHAKQKGRNTYQRYTLAMKDKDRRITGIT
jgi:diguanylate cyclase (GGDEF)-like protein/PAS domain S-box-containing protein